MTDLGETLATDAAQEIVRALAAGVVEAVKRIPNLWHRSGGRREELIRAEVERSAATLAAAGDDLPAVRARQEGAWEARLRDLLDEHPEVELDLRGILEESRRQAVQEPAAVQNVTASAPGATAQGAMFGNVISYHVAPPTAESTRPHVNGEQ